MKIRLKELRAKYGDDGISIRKLVEISGVSKSLIERIENGTGNPTADTLCKLAKALGVTLNDLVDCGG